MGWTVHCGRPPLLLPSCRKLEFRLSALMDSDLAWVNGKRARQSWSYADAFQRSIISGTIYHLTQNTQNNTTQNTYTQKQIGPTLQLRGPVTVLMLLKALKFIPRGSIKTDLLVHNRSQQIRTGWQVSSVNSSSTFSGRHSMASKYIHCCIGINFPVHA